MSKTYDEIRNITVGTATPTVEFTSIPQTFTDLVLVVNAIPASGPNIGLMRINGDTGANYSMTGMRGNGSTAVSYRQNGVTNLWFDYAGDTIANTITNSIIHFFNYAVTTMQKTNLVRQNNASDTTEIMAQKWASTSAITSISLYWSTGNFAVGSSFTLYGIKAE